MANFSNGSVTVTTTPTMILPGRGRRIGFIFQNRSGSEIFIGPDTSITITNTVSLLAGGYLNESAKVGLFRGPIFGVVDSGTAEIRFWEWGE